MENNAKTSLLGFIPIYILNSHSDFDSEDNEETRYA